MNVPRYASQVARLLSGTSGHVGAPPDDRARGIATIERAIAARQKSRALRFWLLAAAAIVLVASTGAWFASPVASSSVRRQPAEQVSVTLSARGAGATLSPGHATLHDGDRLFAGSAVSVNREGSATLALSTGTRLELEADASVRANELDRQQRFYLSKGALSAKVAKLSAGQRFVVETPDAEIEVRGTEFRLEVPEKPDGCNGRTRLQVHEGVVEVRANGKVVRVGAGQRWPASCASEASLSEPSSPVSAREPSTLQAPSSRSSLGTQPARRMKSPETAESEGVSSSALVEQNDAFAEGVTARRRGDMAGAIAAYGRLMQKYPNSALVENAMVERMRLFGKSNPALARQEAQRYLARYPSGFARAEAESIASGSP